MLSFWNLIEAHVLRALRTEHGVSVKDVRKALQYAERELRIDRLLLRRELCSHAGQLFLDRYGELISLSTSGQLAMKRLLDARDGFKYYEAGMDLGFSEAPAERFEILPGKILGEYEKMVPEFDITAIDATLPIEAQQVQMRKLVKAKLEQAKRLRVAP